MSRQQNLLGGHGVNFVTGAELPIRIRSPAKYAFVSRNRTVMELSGSNQSRSGD
jgi:hypothetical protein